MKTHNFRKIVSLIALNVLLVSAQADITTGLVAYYPLNGNALDVSNNGNDGKPVAITWITNEGRQCAKFSSGSHVLVTNKPSINITGPFTITLWVKPDQTQNNNYPTLVNKHDGIKPQYELDISRHGTNFYSRGCIGNNPNCFDSFGSTPLATGEWNMLTFVYTGQQERQHLNGNLVHSANAPASPTALNNHLALGVSVYNLSSYQFLGLMDEVRIYNRALSDSDVWQLYTQAAAITGKISNHRCPSGLRFW